MAREDPGAGGLMTFAQFAFLAVLLLPFFLRFRDPETGHLGIYFKHKTPLMEYLKMTIIFFVGSVASNKAFELGVTQPFAVIFRSLSLLVSYLIGMFWFNKKYTARQFIAVCLVTLGVLVTTLGEVYLKSGIPQKLDQCCSTFPIWQQAYIVATNQPILGLDAATQSADETSFGYHMLILATTTTLLTFTLVGLAVLGHLQSKCYSTYKSDAIENMFFLHLMPIPMFAMLASDLRHHFTLWNASAPFVVLGIEVPWLWWLCFLNVLTQCVCLAGVHNTTSSMGTLVCTFATTVRKFLSLIFSVLYFQSPFTLLHTSGAALVFFGTYLFATAPTPPAPAPTEKTLKKD